MNKPIANPIYNPQTSEPHWQATWEDQQLFQDSAKLSKTSKEIEEKLYLLFAFAYPSGSGLHVGHVESKTALDILARYNRMHGKDVFFPVGWDAFGLPAENYAIKTGIHPSETTKSAITTFRRQIKRLGISYDWANEIATNHPEYYKWTQWIFIQLFKAGLAYRKKGSVNWCPQDKTVLANEQVVNGACERCGTAVIQKDLEQWFFKITHYQDELISGLDTVDWPQPTKQQQLNWIGKKTGINITYRIKDSSQTVTCFTTRPDTNFGATFIVLAPEHPLAQQAAQDHLQVQNYLAQAASKTELERQQEGRQKTGVFTGLFALNNLSSTNALMPIWISDFVLGGFGTGAVVGVPGHDLRDFEFAQFVNAQPDQSKIDIIRVVVGNDGDSSPITRADQVQEEAGVMVNSGFLDGLEIAQATQQVTDHLEAKGWGKSVTTYKLRDWLISRQRYWGAPIPMIYCEACAQQGKGEVVRSAAQSDQAGWYSVPAEQLPVRLPDLADFTPTDDGHSPLEKADTSWYHVPCPGCGAPARREVDTMDTFVDSSWYYLRYTDSRNSQVFADPKQLAHWLPVDFYMIGPEHIVLHLLYSRFFTKFLRDQGYLKFDEPFKKMRHQGMILGPDNKKMSKSKGNVINPDAVVEKFGADTLRVYEMFMGPIEADKPWNERALAGVYRFLNRVHSLVVGSLATSTEGAQITAEDSLVVRRKLHQTVRKLTSDIPNLKFNTSIASLMEFVNVWDKQPSALSPEEAEICVKMIAPFAPFLAEELFHALTDQLTTSSVHTTTWPEFNAALAEDQEIIIPVQVNGKVRAQLIFAAGTILDEQEVTQQARQLKKVQKWLAGAAIHKVIYVPGKIVNIVVAN